jgi:tetratricopeptide (TPR) repeat protein/predicted Ser/Thr protein kinase
MKDSDRTLGSDGTVGGLDAAPTFVPSEEAATLPLGTVLATRYQIVDLLGVGGMGAVYKAFDRQLTRVVALKTILPEMAATPTALKRFKQEVLLAQSITHKNVVRIFDIGEDGATKFITMDFIEGVDLKGLVAQKGKLSPAEAAGIIRQVCQGLEAAHAAGVVHRDLKPQNIMIQNDGRIVVMDFGIARSGESRGATQTGAFLGTPEYMSPEQARTENVDARSDIFSLGLIFYELLTGKLPFKGKTVLETMFKRTTERAIPPAEIDATVPKGANDIVNKCLQPECENRYQSVTELLEDLETFDPTKKVSAADRAKSRLRKAARYRNWAVGAALVLMAVAVVALVLRNRSAAPKAPVQHAPETVLIADFINRTGNPIFDGTLEPVVKLGLEGAGFITAYDRNQLKSLGAQPVSGKLDDTQARQIAMSVNVGVVVSGSLEQQGNGFLVRMKATRAVRGSPIASVEDTAFNKDQVMSVAGKLVGSIRKAFGDETPEVSQRWALDTFTNTSLEAVHEYVTAAQALTDGRPEDALKSYQRAVDLDENFAMAYQGAALAARNLHQSEDAEKYIKLAFNHIDHMTDRERYRTRASYYLVLGNNQKCVEEYTALTTKYPSDSVAHNNLAVCLSQLRELPKALEEGRQAAAIFPKRPMYRLNNAFYALYSGDFETGDREVHTWQEVDPTAIYTKGFVAQAFVQLGQGQLAEAAETYRKLQKIDKKSASMAATGLGDLALYEGRFQDAAKLLDEAANADLANKYPDEAATKFAMLAYMRLLQGPGQKSAAVAAAEKALNTNSKVVKVRFLAGQVLAAAGQKARAKALADGLATELLDEPRSYAKLIEGEIALQAGDAPQAIKLFGEGSKLLNTWIAHFDLGRAYLAAGAFPEADSEFDGCIRRRGEALALFLDESPTYGFLPPVYYYLGRVREGLKSSGFAESYRKYISIREKAGEQDPLLSEVHKRAGQ